MDKGQFNQRESSLKYLIGAFENEHGWLNTVRVNVNQASLTMNAPAIIQLGEALSTKKQATLVEYFDTWYRAFKEYEAVFVKAKVPHSSGVRKVFRNRFSKDKAALDHTSSLSSEVSSLALSSSEPSFSSHEEGGVLHNIAPFPLDGRIVFLCLCETVLVMYEAIQELTTGEWTAQEKELYTKLDNKIKSLVIEPGMRMMDNDAKAVIGTERRFLRFGR